MRNTRVIFKRLLDADNPRQGDWQAGVNRLTNSCLEIILMSLAWTCHIPRAALTTHELEWLEPWGKLAELELKCLNRELVYVGNTNVTQST